jgi:hypothetical protein
MKKYPDEAFIWNRFFIEMNFQDRFSLFANIMYTNVVGICPHRMEEEKKEELA